MTGNIPDNRERIPESLLSLIWKGQWIQKGPLPASDGRLVRIRTPGTRNRDQGPDFLNASILIEDEILTGDIELHVKSSDWRSHGHHLDPHYNSVILQVTLWNDAAMPALLENGYTAPTLCLYDFLEGSVDELSIKAEEEAAPRLPCVNAAYSLNKEYLDSLLDAFGLERFYIKAARFELEMITEEPSQVVYEGIMETLGYTKNKEPFKALASHLRLGVLESMALERATDDRLVFLQAILLGCAGLLPSQSAVTHLSGLSVEVEKLEEIWASLNLESPMSYGDWHFFRMHPGNFPTNRLIAATNLLDRYIDEGLLSGISRLVDECDTDKGVNGIENGLIISRLLGRERAREMVINTVMPFLYSWAEINSNLEGKQHILELFRVYPRSGDNQITRYIRDLWWNKPHSKITVSSQRQQGMIHLYKTFCADRRCGDCPVNESLPAYPPKQLQPQQYTSFSTDIQR